MADDQDKLLIDEEETVQIKDLNRVKIVNNNDLLLLDDGVASSNAITFKNFLDASKDKIFKGEGLDYFKQIIKSTIAEELAADKDFVEKIYAKITDKLINNDSTNISNLFSKIKSRLTNSISSATLSKNDDLLIMSSSSIQKTPIPEQLLGVPSDFQSSYDLSSLIDIFSKFEDEFDEIAHKGFFLVYDLYSHYKLIYTANMERLESALTPAINAALAPLNEKINQCIDLVNSDEKNLKISNDLKFNQEGKPIYKERTNNAK